MKSSALVTRSWNGHAIQRRLADGYVNATAMCQVAGRRWHHYAVNLRASEYMQALQGSTGIPADLLAQTVVTGSNAGRGTWVHPRLAVDLARWISPEFAVWMDGWILEELEAKAKEPKGLACLSNEDVGEVISVLCADIGQACDRLAAMAGWPTADSLTTAKDCLRQVQRRTAVVHQLLATVQPIRPARMARVQ
jgi:hypothetical protein